MNYHYDKILAPAKLVAHRGHRDQFPENSLLAIIDAIAAGAVNIEFDIQITADGIPVLYHDLGMQRISGVAQSITDITEDQLHHYNVSEPERFGATFIGNGINQLCDIAPLIQHHPGVVFFVELKEESIQAHGLQVCMQSLQKALSSTGQMHTNIVFASDNNESVTQAKAYGFKKTALVFRDWQSRNALLQVTLADFGFINYQYIPDSVAIVADKPLILYEVADTTLAHRLLNRGAMAIETFCIRKMLGNE